MPLPYLLITMKAIESEKFLLVICEISRLFVNTLTVDDKYSLLNTDNLTQAIHMILSQNQKKTFSCIFLAFLNCLLKYKNFAKRDDPHSYVFEKLRTLKNVIR